MLALAIIAEQSGDYFSCFTYHRRLNYYYRNKLRSYSQESDIQDTKSIIQAFSPSLIGSIKLKFGYDTNFPVFIVGLPYSGTWLLEAILCKHKKIFAIHDRENYIDEMEELLKKRLKTIFASYVNELLEAVSNSDRQGVESMGWQIVTEMRKISQYISHTGEGQILHYIDTELSNFKLVGLIHCVFPNAVIINMVRDPLDTLMDCYRDVDGHASSDTWRLSFPSMISYYTNYLRLMGHWRRVLPDRVIDLNADLLREDPRRALAPVLDALGLRWEKEMNAIDLSLSSLSVPGHWRRFSPMVDELVRPLSQSLAEVGKVYPLPFADEINWSLTPTHRLYKDLVRPVHSAVEGSGPEKKKKGGQSPPPVPTTKRMPAPLASPTHPEVEELYTATIAPAEVQSLRTLSAQLPFLTGDTKVIRCGGGGSLQHLPCPLCRVLGLDTPLTPLCNKYRWTS